jgi:hypothetical protein
MVRPECHQVRQLAWQSNSSATPKESPCSGFRPGGRCVQHYTVGSKGVGESQAGQAEAGSAHLFVSVAVWLTPVRRFDQHAGHVLVHVAVR